MRIIPLLLLLGAMTSANAQFVISGKITDKHSREPLEDAVVFQGSRAAAVLTDKEGRFKLTVTNPADSIYVNYIGYQTVCLCANACCQHPEIALERRPMDLKALTITPCTNGCFHTLSRVDLNLRPVNSAQDLMRLVPGLFLGQHQGGGIAEHIFYRGFDADHGTDVNVSVDGMPINLVSHVHGQGFSDLHFLIPELVSKVDYGKGPYFAEYGDFATAGYVAFRTVDVLDRSEVKIDAGTFNTARVMAKINLLNGNVPHDQSAYIAGEAAYTDGPFDQPQRFHRVNLFSKYNVSLSPKTKLTATFSTFESKWRSSGEIPLRAVDEGVITRFGYIDSAQGGHTGRSNMILKLKTILGNHMVLENQTYYSHYYFTSHYDPTLFAGDSVNGDQLRQQESRNVAGYNGRLSHHAYVNNGDDLISALGLGAQVNFIRNSSLSHTLNRDEVLDDIQLGNIREHTANGYIDENYRHGKWAVNAGLRWDYLYFCYQDKLNTPLPDRGRLIASPKLSISYTANTDIQFYARAGRGFHSNDAKVVTGNRGLDVLPAAYGAELGLNWKPLPKLYLNAAAWWLTLQQEFTYNADEGTFDPGDKTRRQGIDISARYQFTHWLYANFDLNYCKARDAQASKGNNYLPLAVPLSSTGGLDFKLSNGVNGGLSYRYMKDRPANADNSLVAKGYFVSDLTANYTRHHYEFGLEIQNLFNTQWREAQYEVTSRMRGELRPIDDISFTPGTPFFLKFKMAVFF